MEELEGANSPPADDIANLPEGNNDPGDPVRPEVEEEDAATTPPLADPTADTEVNSDENANIDDNASDSDALSEIDEAQFEDFDPNAVAIDERRVVDADDLTQLGKHKRKRDEGEDEERKKKRKEGRRDKPKRKKHRDEDAGAEGGDEIDGDRRSRKHKDGGERRKRRTPSPENDEHLTPEERRKKEFNRRLDEALKKPKPARRRGGIDLEAMADEELERMRHRMAEAAKADTLARENGKPAMHKLKMLPDVVSLLNRNTLQNNLVDPDINILESVRFFLEPLNDGSLPAYNIQRELFSSLTRLPITKDALVASGIGKVTHFYTRSPRVEPAIKRAAEKLVGDWTRPILKRTDDYRKREFVEADYDPLAASQRPNNISNANLGSQQDRDAKRAAARKAALAVPGLENRARPDGGVGTYSIVPRSDVSRVQGGVKRLGASGDELFRKLKARHAGSGGGAGGRGR